MEPVVAAGAFAQIAVQQRQADTAVVTGILVAGTRQTVVDLRIVLSYVYSEILISLPVHHQSLNSTDESRPSFGEPVNFTPVPEQEGNG